MSHRLEIIIPMAGEGQRFKDAGYGVDKPFIPISPHKSMIKAVTENLRPLSNYFTYLCKPVHIPIMESLIIVMGVEGRCIAVDQHTNGSVGTVIQARDRIAPEVPVIIANCDQLIEYDPGLWETHLSENRGHCIWCFGPASHPKWSYAKVENGRVIEVAEKRPISEIATVGVYYWAHWSDYVEAADKMMSKGLRISGEYYNAPVYNEAISKGDLVTAFYPFRMIGLGTPEDLEIFVTGKL